MLPLADPIWDELSCVNITGREFAGILARYYQGDIPQGELLYDDLTECICQYEVYDSSFAAAPHLVRIASTCAPDPAAAMLLFALYAIMEALSGEQEVDPRLAVFLSPAREEGLRTALRVFPLVSERSPERRYLDAAMLGFQGDAEGYRAKMNEIDAQDREASERYQAEVDAINKKPGVMKVHRVSGHESWKIIEPS